MSDLLGLPEMQMRRIEPYFPLSHTVPMVSAICIAATVIFWL